MDVNYSINGGAAVTQSLSNLTINTYDNYPFDHATTWNPTTAELMMSPFGQVISMVLVIWILQTILSMELLTYLPILKQEDQC